MDLRAKIYLERAENEIILAKINFEISLSNELKKKLNISLDRTFFSNVISEGYYSIFYSAKAYLINKGIKTEAPEEHKKTYIKFKKFVDSGEIDKELLKIYRSENEKADALLKIFNSEKAKRGRFTYNINSNANIPYAEESIDHAVKFVSLIKSIIEK